MQPKALINLDLLSVGIAIAAIGILGFGIFFNNRKSATGRTFLAFSLITIFWGIANYLSYNVSDPQQILWVQRTVIFLGVWHSFTFLTLFWVFPRENANFPGWYLWGAAPIAVVTSLVNLTPLVFEQVSQLSQVGTVSVLKTGPGIALFGATVMCFIAGGIVLLLIKTIKASGIEKTQFRFLSLGTVITFLLIIAFNIVLPAGFEVVRFIPLGAVFILPFAIFASYAIIKHHLLNVKVVATEILTFILAVVSLLEVMLAGDTFILVFRVAIFLLILSFGILLIKSVLREVEQREELQRLNKQLEEAKGKLEDLSRFKTQLLSLASHQIKSPLAAIKGFVSLILDGSYGETTDKTKETLARVKRSADGLIDLVNSILDLRKVEEGRMDYQFKKTDIVRIANDVVDGLRPLAMEKKLDFSFSSPEGEIFVNADEEKLKQVIQNITDNAIKYTPSGFVKVEIHDSGSEVTISVSDSGLGISPILIPHIFEEFTRDERVKKEIRGTGLGLYIVQKITEAHGGQILAESAGEGKGSKFVVTLKKIS